MTKNDIRGHDGLDLSGTSLVDLLLKAWEDSRATSETAETEAPARLSIEPSDQHRPDTKDEDASR